MNYAVLLFSRGSQLCGILADVYVLFNKFRWQFGVVILPAVQNSDLCFCTGMHTMLLLENISV